MTAPLETFIQITKKPKIDCPVCLEPLTKGVVVHSGIDGKKHPCHWKCIESWIYSQKNCPVCKVNIASHKMKSLQEQHREKGSSAHSQLEWEEVAHSIALEVTSRFRIDLSDPRRANSIYSGANIGIVALEVLNFMFDNMNERLR